MTKYFFSTLLIAFGLVGCSATTDGPNTPEVPDVQNLNKADSTAGFADFTAEGPAGEGSVLLNETAARELFEAMMITRNELGLVLGGTESFTSLVGETLACATSGEQYACRLFVSVVSPNTHTFTFNSAEALEILALAAMAPNDRLEIFMTEGDGDTVEFSLASAGFNCVSSIYGSRCTVFDDTFEVSLKMFGTVPELGDEFDYAVSLVNEAGERTLVGQVDGPDGIVRAGSSEQSLVRGLGETWRMDAASILDAVAVEISIEHVTDGTVMVIDTQALQTEDGGLSSRDFFSGSVSSLLGEYGSVPTFDASSGELEGMLDETSVRISR